MLFHYTHQGIEHVKQSPDRVDALKKIFNKHGAKIKDFYALLGQYDTLFMLMRPTTKRSPNFPCTSLSRATRGSRRTARSPRQNFASCCRRSTNHGCKQRSACQSCVIFNEVTILCAYGLASRTAFPAAGSHGTECGGTESIRRWLASAPRQSLNFGTETPLAAILPLPTPAALARRPSELARKLLAGDFDEDVGRFQCALGGVSAGRQLGAAEPSDCGGLPRCLARPVARPYSCTRLLCCGRWAARRTCSSSRPASSRATYFAGTGITAP